MRAALRCRGKGRGRPLRLCDWLPSARLARAGRGFVRRRRAWHGFRAAGDGDRQTEQQCPPDWAIHQMDPINLKVIVGEADKSF